MRKPRSEFAASAAILAFVAANVLTFAGVVGCAQTPVAAADPVAVVPASQLVTEGRFNAAAAGVLRAVTLARTSLTALAVAGRITPDQDRRAGAQLDLVVGGVRAAVDLRKRDPQAAAVQLAASLASYQAIRQQASDSAALQPATATKSEGKTT